MDEDMGLNKPDGKVTRTKAERIMLKFNNQGAFENFYTEILNSKLPFNLAPRLGIAVYKRDFVQFPENLTQLVKTYEGEGLLTVTTYTPRANRRILTREETKERLRRPPLREW